MFYFHLTSLSSNAAAFLKDHVHLRYSKEEREERQKDRQKREKEAMEIAAAQPKRLLEDDELSKNKLKKIKRNPAMVFREKKGRDHYEKCGDGCGNIRVRVDSHLLGF